MRAQVTLEIAKQPLGLAADVTLVVDVIPLAGADLDKNFSVVLRQVVGLLKLTLDIINLPRLLAVVGLVAYWCARV